MGRKKLEGDDKEPSKKNMNWEIAHYPCYKLAPRGRLVQVALMTTDDYNHQITQCHHFIPYNLYKRDRKWYKERGIEQKLILMPTFIHEQVHNTAIKNLSDEEFTYRYGISRWELVFNRKYTKY